MEIYENNLMSEYHIRYGGYGGIAYHHVSDTYIALFTHFIACGVWEAVYILDGLLKNTSDIQPDTLHADTQGQSSTVFALSHLLGIELMPRIRNWKDLDFLRPHEDEVYDYIEPLFDNVAELNESVEDKKIKNKRQVLSPSKKQQQSESKEAKPDVVVRKTKKSQSKPSFADRASRTLISKFYNKHRSICLVLRSTFIFDNQSSIETGLKSIVSPTA